jgi:membrane protease YdiL (CAAX protease family)
MVPGVGRGDDTQMNVAQVFLFLVPVLAYGAIRHWKSGDSWRVIQTKLGLRSGTWTGYQLALGLCVLAIVATWIVLHALPASVLHDSRTTNAQSAQLTLGPGTLLAVLLQQLFLVAFGEELFFRGLLGGWLVRWLGFQKGNAIQATLFLLPHTLLLLVSLAFWPLLIVQWLMGWLNGWLRTRCVSCGPGLLVHTVANTAALILAI